jgi:hypothetical protein
MFNYRCSFFSIVRASPQAARVTQAFRLALVQSHPPSHTKIGL